MNSVEYGSILVKSAEMLAVLKLVEKFQPSDRIFIVGQKGAGKFTLAQHIQKNIFKDQVVPLCRGLQEMNANLKNGIVTVSYEEWSECLPQLKNLTFKMVEIPSLSERKADLPQLAEFFLQSQFQ